MAELTVDQALKNIDVVVASAKMSRAEHMALGDSILIVKNACSTPDSKPEMEEEKDE